MVIYSDFTHNFIIKLILFVIIGFSALYLIVFRKTTVFLLNEQKVVINTFRLTGRKIETYDIDGWISCLQNYADENDVPDYSTRPDNHDCRHEALSIVYDCLQKNAY